MKWKNTILIKKSVYCCYSLQISYRQDSRKSDKSNKRMKCNYHDSQSSVLTVVAVHRTIAPHNIAPIIMNCRNGAKIQKRVQRTNFREQKHSYQGMLEKNSLKS